MDILTVNKIAAGLIVSLLVVKLAGWFAEATIEAEVPERPAYRVAVAQASDATGAAAQTQAAKEPSLAELLANASADKGAKVFRKCGACHTIDAGAGNRIGPNLHDVVGAPVAHRSDFAYSDALRNHGGSWTYEMLDHWIADPKAAIPGNKMAFAGIRKARDRANLIAFLRANTTNPPPLPAASSQDEASGEAAADGGR